MWAAGYYRCAAYLRLLRAAGCYNLGLGMAVQILLGGFTFLYVQWRKSVLAAQGIIIQEFKDEKESQA
jgi:hypothetical protein